MPEEILVKRVKPLRHDAFLGDRAARFVTYFALQCCWMLKTLSDFPVSMLEAWATSCFLAIILRCLYHVVLSYID